MKNKCEVDQAGIICNDDAIGILVWKKTELVLAVCQEHTNKVNSKRCELKRFDTEICL
jgi:hypothetical protein